MHMQRCSLMKLEHFSIFHCVHSGKAASQLCVEPTMVNMYDRHDLATRGKVEDMYESVHT